jgi:hypothetical protein
MTTETASADTALTTTTKYVLQYATCDTPDSPGYINWVIAGLEDNDSTLNALFESEEDAWDTLPNILETMRGYDLGDQDTEWCYTGWCERAYFLLQGGKQIETMLFCTAGEVQMSPGEEIKISEIEARIEWYA